MTGRKRQVASLRWHDGASRSSAEIARCRGACAPVGHRGAGLDVIVLSQHSTGFMLFWPGKGGTSPTRRCRAAASLASSRHWPFARKQQRLRANADSTNNNRARILVGHWRRSSSPPSLERQRWPACFDSFMRDVKTPGGDTLAEQRAELHERRTDAAEHAKIKANNCRW